MNKKLNFISRAFGIVHGDNGFYELVSQSGWRRNRIFHSADRAVDYSLIAGRGKASIDAAVVKTTVTNS